MTPVQLEPFPPLELLSESARALIDTSHESFRLDPKQAVIYCGESVAGTYFVTGGELRVYCQDSEGREKTLYHVRPGQTCILAVNSAFSGLSYPAWVATGERGAEGFVLPGATYRKLFETEPALRDFTVRGLTRWIHELMTSIEEGALRTIGERLARALLRRVDHDGRVHGTHQDFAHDLGTAREVVSRHLGRFEEWGLVRRGRGSITILDRRGLLAAGVRAGD